MCVPATIDRLSKRISDEATATAHAGEHQGPRAILNVVERLAGAYASECVRVRQELGIAESQLRDYTRLGCRFRPINGDRCRRVGGRDIPLPAPEQNSSLKPMTFQKRI